MKKAIIIGNGTSRLSFNLHEIKQNPKLYSFGCNALYRDFTPTVLVSVDKKITEEIQQSNYPLTNLHYTSYDNEYEYSNLYEINNISSGPYATLIALDIFKIRTIYLFGMDFKGIDKKFNNVYANTECYKQSTDNETFYGLWIKQYADLIERYNDARFVHLNPIDSYSPSELTKYKNFHTKTFDSFEEL